MSSRLSWPASLRPWRRWIIAVLVVVVMRAALPLVLRSVIASQASKALHARVEVGDVDLALYRLGIALKDVAVFAAAQPADAGAASGGPNPDATPTAATEQPAPANAAAADDPLIAWKRFELSVRWLPLFRKSIVLREVVLDSPRVSLDRLADGKLNLMALVPASSEGPAPSPTPAETAPAGSGWGFGLDRLILRDGGVRFRDFKVKDTEPIELNIPTVDVTHVYLIPGVYGEPSKVSVTVDVDQGSLQVEATMTQRSATENQLEAYLKVRNLLLRRGRLYIPKVGWSAMEGALDADITYNFTTGTQSAVRGAVTVSKFAVHVANIDEPALGWKNLTVKIDPIDLHAQHAVVSAVELNGASLLVRPQGGDLLPFLAAAHADNAAAVAAHTAAPASPPASPPAAAPAQAPRAWRWSVSALHIADTKVRLLGTDPPLDIGVGLDLTGLVDRGEQPAHLALALTAGPGTVNVDGGVRVAPPGFGGTVRIADLSLSELAAAAGALPRDLLHAAKLGSDLTVEAGLASGTDAGPLGTRDVRVHGKLSLADVQLSPPASPDLAVGVHSVDLTLADAQVPGVLPGQPAAAGENPTGSLHPGDVHASGKLSVGDVDIKAAGPQGYTFALHALDLGITSLSARGVIPHPNTDESAPAAQRDVQVGGRLTFADLKLTGTDAKAFAVGVRSLDLPFKGISVADLGHTPPGPMRVALGDVRLTKPSVRIMRTADGLALPRFSAAPAADAAAPTPTQAPAPAVAAEPPHVDVTVDAFRLTDGNVSVVDRTVKPFYEGGLSALNIDVSKLHWPDLSIGSLRVAATGADQGKLDVYGALTPGSQWFEVNGDKLALVPFNPYATTFSGYSIATGKASVVSKVSYADQTYYASNYLTLHDLDVRGGGGESLFQKQFGIPLSMALALMRDTDGNIGLDIPVSVGAEGTTIGIATVIRGALQSAIMGALTSPLKLMGAAFSGDKVEAIVPPAIPFRPGRPELAGDGAEQVNKLADLLASRPGIGVALDTAVTASDVRWLREQALREEWAGQGLFAKLKDLPNRAARERIEKALEARAHDQEATLDREDAATLDRWLDERPPIPAEQLRALADARLARVENELHAEHGVEADRITRRPVPADISSDAPAVRVEIGSVGAPADAPTS
jgi:uncharacterized protein involved in outer membrane biogenesis